jgi:hypothetical protein
MTEVVGLGAPVEEEDDAAKAVFAPTKARAKEARIVEA